MVNYLQKRLDDPDLKFKANALLDSDLSGDSIYPLMRFCYDYYHSQIISQEAIIKTIAEYSVYLIYVDKTGYDDKDLKVLGEISVHNLDQAVCFVAGESNVDRLLDNLILAYSNGNNPLSIGGDGRNNQIFLATWISKQHIQESVDHITFYAIEEPEAHLHPHQQRKLASYIMDKFNSQVFITTHIRYQ